MRRLTPIIGIGLAVLLLIAVSVRSLLDLRDAFGYVDHAQTVIRQIGELQGEVLLLRSRSNSP